MQPVVGVICEYDPFHRGHAKQFALIREALPDAAIVCAMSGCFTQRGAPSLLAPSFRAARALEAGADIVLELPCSFAAADAERFALGGVSLLSALATHLCFGCEDAIEPLARAAALIDEPTEGFTQALKHTLGEGRSFVAAQGVALRQALGAEADLVAKPNNALAVCYLRAICRLNAPLTPLPVIREGDYHADQLGVGYPSSSAVRAALLRNDTASAEAACGYAFGGASMCRPDALDNVLLDRLRSMSREQLRELPHCVEGLENRLYAAARQAIDRNDLLALLKTKRYSYARLSRLVTHAMLGMTAQCCEDEPVPTHAKLLGLRRSAASLLKPLQNSSLTISAEPSTLDRRAGELWALGARLPAGWIRQQPVHVLDL